MAVFRCKMCGGDLPMTEGASSCTCEFCGTEQTIPTVKDEMMVFIRVRLRSRRLHHFWNYCLRIQHWMRFSYLVAQMELTTQIKCLNNLRLIKR